MSVIVVVVPIVHGMVPPVTYRAIVWTLGVAAVLFLATIGVWAYLGFTDWLQRRK